MLSTFQDYFSIIEFQILQLYDQLTYSNSQRAYVKFQLRNYYDHKFLEHTSLESLKDHIVLISMRYHSVLIENTYCRKTLSTVTQPLGKTRPP